MHKFRTGDHVRHTLSDEDWVVAYEEATPDHAAAAVA